MHVTEKMDGANVCLTAEQVYARSHSGPAKGRMFDRLKGIHAETRHMIPSYLSVFCEWCMYVHTVEYTSLPSPLLVIGVRDDDTGTWFGWRETDVFANRIGLRTVPSLDVRPIETEDALRRLVENCASFPSNFGKRSEGVVVRVSEPVADERFGKFFAKFVNEGFEPGEQLGELKGQGFVASE